MAGLLDFLTTQDPARQQGLLGAAAALLQAGGPSRFPISTGQGLAGALLGYQQGKQGYEDREQQKALYDLKLRGLRGELEDSDRARADKRAIEQAARDSLMTPGMQALAGGGGPTNENAARIPSMQGGFDIDGFLNRATAINPLTAIELRKSLAKAGPKFDAGITWVNGPDGKPVAVRTADDGSIKQVEGLSPRDKLELANLGGKDVAYNPFALQPGQEFKRTLTPGEAASNQIGLANLSLSRERLALERQNAVKPVYDSERGVLINTRNGVAAPIQNVDGSALGSKDARQKTADARDVIALLDQADPLIDKATSSYIGQAADQTARLFGRSTDGSEAAAQLKAIEGSLVSKMPKMSGPQSDKDVLLYRQMAGQIGDPTVPAAAKKAAMSTIREINQRYLDGGQQPAAPAGNKVATLSDIAATARASGRSTAEVTAALRAKGYTIGGQ